MAEVWFEIAGLKFGGVFDVFVHVAFEKRSFHAAPESAQQMSFRQKPFSSSKTLSKPARKILSSALFLHHFNQ